MRFIFEFVYFAALILHETCVNFTAGFICISQKFLFRNAFNFLVSSAMWVHIQFATTNCMQQEGSFHLSRFECFPCLHCDSTWRKKLPISIFQIKHPPNNNNNKIKYSKQWNQLFTTSIQTNAASKIFMITSSILSWAACSIFQFNNWWWAFLLLFDDRILS